MGDGRAGSIFPARAMKLSKYEMVPAQRISRGEIHISRQLHPKDGARLQYHTFVRIAIVTFADSLNLHYIATVTEEEKTFFIFCAPVAYKKVTKAVHSNFERAAVIVVGLYCTISRFMKLATIFSAVVKMHVHRKCAIFYTVIFI